MPRVISETVRRKSVFPDANASQKIFLCFGIGTLDSMAELLPSACLYEAVQRSMWSDSILRFPCSE